jgi:hypothetical protein
MGVSTGYQTMVTTALRNTRRGSETEDALRRIIREELKPSAA